MKDETCVDVTSIIFDFIHQMGALYRTKLSSIGKLSL